MSPKWGTQKVIPWRFFGPPGPYGAKWGPEGGKRCSRVPKNQDLGPGCAQTFHRECISTWQKCRRVISWTGGKILRWESLLRPKRIDRAIEMDANGVTVACHGLILSKDGATASRKLFKSLRGLFYIIFWLKI